MLTAVFTCVLLSACDINTNLGTPDTGVTEDGGTVVDAGVRPLRLFVTSRYFRGNVGGLSAADQACQQAAAAQNLPGIFKAYLSASTGNAVDRQSANGPWSQYRADGQVLLTFNGRANLRTLPLVPIRITETGTELELDGGQYIWTGTVPGGASSSAGTQAVNCMDWVDTQNVGVAGVLGATDETWTCLRNMSTLTAIHCDTDARLLCLEQ